MARATRRRSPRCGRGAGRRAGSQVEIKHSDTDLAPRGGGTTGSRSAQLGGSAAYGAAVEMLELARQRAADLLEANVVDIVVDPESGALHVLGSPVVSLGWEELGTNRGRTPVQA